MRVLTIDLSGNVKDFEYEMSRQLHSFLRRNEIAVAHPAPLMPKTLREFGEIAEMQCDFNTLLLVTHGKPDAGGPTPSHVQVTEELSEVTDVFANWYEVAALAPPLEDKLLCLVVCSGMCSDMKEALVADGRFAKVVVAPISDLNYLETLLFYQSFFLALHAASQHSIDTDVVLETVDKYNSKANGKMRVFSELLRSGSTSESLDTGVGQGLSRILDSE